MKGKNEIILYGSVGEIWDTEAYFDASTVRTMLDGRSGPLTVRLNSGGGIASEGLALFTMLRDYPGEVHVIVDSMAASAATLVMMAGDKITMRLGSIVLIHDPSVMFTIGRGTEADHIQTAEQLRVLADAYAEVYAARTGLSKDECREIMRAETLMDADEAIRLGFATDRDEIEAVAASPFAYALYQNAPAHLREAHASLVMPREAPTPAKDTTMSNDVTPVGEDVVPAVEAGIETPADAEVEVEAQIEPTPEVTEEVVADLPPTPESVVIADAGDLTRERARVKAIMAAAQIANTPMAVTTDLIERGVDEATALETILQTRSKESDTMSHRPATITADARDKFAKGAELAIMARAGIAGGERNEFTSLSLTELARESLMIVGQNGRFTDRRELVGAALMQSTTDFADILANVANKSALRGWDEAPETYTRWANVGSVSDFKVNTRVGLGQFGSLPVLAEGASYTQGTIGDTGQTIQAVTYGRVWTITRQAIINDDLSLLSSVPTKMGRAARRTVGDLAYGVLTSNPLLSDGVALFAAGHNNLGTGAFSVAALTAARTAMKLQKEDGAILGVSPRFLIVPAALETAAEQLMKSTVEVANSRGHAINPVAGMAEVIAEGRLDANSATAFYLVADKMFDTVEVVFLDGNDRPYVEQEVSFENDGLSVKCRIDAGAAPMGYQGVYKSTGAVA